jgi:hypothetical protein
LVVRNEQLAYARELGSDTLVVALNASDKPAPLEVPVAGAREGEWVDLLEPQRRYPLRGGRLQLGAMPPMSGRVLRPG